MSNSVVDFLTPFDPTAFTSITGGQLEQLVAAATPYSDKGLILVNADNNGVPLPPDAGTTVKWKNYLWLRVVPNNSTLVLYAWNPNGQSNIAYSDGSSSTLLSNWIPIISSAIPPASILGNQIAANTILPGNINLSLLATALGFNPGTTVTTGTTPTGGIITGTFAGGFTIAASSVTNAMLTALTITGASIAAATIDYTKLIGDGTAGDMLKSTGTPSIAPVWFTPPLIFTTAGIPVATNGSKLLAVNAGATDYTLVAPGSVGRILQKVYGSISATSTLTAGALGADASNRAYNEGNVIDFLDLAITPSVGSTLFIKATIAITTPNNGYVWIYLYNGTGASTPIAATRWANPTNNGPQNMSMNFNFKIASPGVLTTYRLGIGGSQSGIGASTHGELSAIEIEEYI